MSTTEGKTKSTDNYGRGSCPYGVKEASELLTVAETTKIEQHFGGTFGASVEQGGIRPTQQVVGMIWAFERRRCLAESKAKLTEWADLDDWTLRELNGYFVDDEIEVDADAPEGAQGKGV